MGVVLLQARATCWGDRDNVWADNYNNVGQSTTDYRPNTLQLARAFRIQQKYKHKHTQATTYLRSLVKGAWVRGYSLPHTDDGLIMNLEIISSNNNYVKMLKIII